MKSEEVINKLSGLSKGEKRVFFIEIKSNGDDYNAVNSKLLFKTANEAVEAFKYLSTASPIIYVKDSLYSWTYKNIEDELKTVGELEFGYLDTSKITLGSEVIKAYNGREEAKLAKDKKNKELIERDEQAKRDKAKKEKGGVPF